MKYDFEIFLFADALGWEMVRQTGFMKMELPYRRRIEMQFGYSMSAISTILSGKTPAEHGRLGNFSFDPENSPFKGLTMKNWLLKTEVFWNHGLIRHWVSKRIGKRYGFSGDFQLHRMTLRKLRMMDCFEKRDLFVPGGLGEIENLNDLLLRKRIIFHLSDWRSCDRENMVSACNALRKGFRFLFVYTSELDDLLHEYPVLPAVPVQKKLDWYRFWILKIMEICRQGGRRARLTVLSDHGMSLLTQTVNLQAAIEKTPLVFGQDYGACYDPTMFRVYFLKAGAEKIIRNAVLPIEGLGHWLTNEEMIRYGIYRRDHAFGDAIFLTNPGVQIVPSDMSGKARNGMHGFAPEDRDSYAAVLSNAEIPPEIRCCSDFFLLMKQRIEDLAQA